MAEDPHTTRCPQCNQSFPTTTRLCPNDGTVLEHATPASSEIGKVLDGKYRLDGFLSRGGMGAVYQATHVMLNKRVAVKLINPELVTSSEIVRRFQREARSATALSHPNIVSVYDLGQTADGTLYIAMEFIDGPSLKSMIEKGGPVPPMRTITIVRQLASALSLAHRQGIIHRDLKPHNVMLARSANNEEIAKLVDFGIAKTFDEGTQLTVAGFSPGTPQYMAPEQAEGKTVDARSDLYSLGIIMYEMLTGDVPFAATSAATVLIKHIKEAPLPPSLKNPSVAIPPALEAITLRLLAKNPDDRFQSADDLIAALDSAAASVASSVSTMDATVPMARPTAAGASSDASAAPTLRVTPTNAPTAPGAHAGTAPTVPAAQIGAQTAATRPAAAARGSSDTRPTAVGAQPAPPAAVVVPPPPAKTGTNPVFVVIMLLMAIGAAAIVYLNYFSGRSSSQPPASAATTSPATAPAATVASAADTPTRPAASEPSAPAASPASALPPTPASAAPSTPAASAPASSAPATPAADARADAPERAPAATATTSRTSAAAPSGANRPAANAAAARVAATATTATAAASAAAQGAAPAASPAAPSARAEPPARPAAAAFPENPSIFFQCGGATEVCTPIRSSVDDAFEKAGFTSTRNASRADISVITKVQVLQERVDRQFDTTFAVRNYSIEVTGEATGSGDVVSMPPSSTLSFDPRFGSERAAEKARLIASDIVDRVKAYVKKKRG